MISLPSFTSFTCNSKEFQDERDLAKCHKFHMFGLLWKAVDPIWMKILRYIMEVISAPVLLKQPFDLFWCPSFSSIFSCPKGDHLQVPGPNSRGGSRVPWFLSPMEVKQVGGWPNREGKNPPKALSGDPKSLVFHFATRLSLGLVPRSISHGHGIRAVPARSCCPMPSREVGFGKGCWHPRKIPLGPSEPGVPLTQSAASMFVPLASCERLKVRYPPVTMELDASVMKVWFHGKAGGRRIEYSS